MERKSATLPDILRWRALHEPEKEVFTFLLDGEIKKAHMTYADLDREARGIAALLQDHAIVGERVLLLYPPGLEYVAAVFGCFYAGVVAVPAYPPRLNQNLTRIRTILQDAQVTTALTLGANPGATTIPSSLRRRFASEPLIRDLRWIETNTMAVGTRRGTGDCKGSPLRPTSDMMTVGAVPCACPAPAYRESQSDPEALALLQYTSGSTDSPKGVMLTHTNLIQNAALLQEGLSLTPEDCGLSWLPPYHDMGLMAGILQSIYTDYPTILMAPAAFVQQPLRWLQALSSFRATFSGGPNFAYDLCVKKATEDTIQALDLSSWQIAFNAAEPVRAETLERFAQTFAPCGFRPEMFYPSYGLAETTLFVSGGQRLDKLRIKAFDGEALETGHAVEVTGDGETGRLLVACGPCTTGGSVRQGQEIAIVDPEKHTRCAPGTIGEIWVRSPNVALGYWGKIEETKKTFQAFLRGDDEGPFLHTGDLGFCVEGELYITGRLKDLIIIRGRNLSPQDIEQVVEKSHPLLRQSCCAAFAVEGQDTEQLVVVQEVVRHHDDVGVQEAIQAICQAVLLEFDVEVFAIELLRAGTIPKTTSGKIQRYACHQSFLSGELNAVYRWNRIQEMPQKHGREQAHAPTDFQIPTPESPLPVPTRFTPTIQDIIDWLVVHIAERAHVAAHTVDRDAPFIQFGLSSLEAVGLSGELEQWLGRSCSPTLIYDYPSINALARYLAGGARRGTIEVGQRAVGAGQGQAQPLRPSAQPDAIAIIGLGCRFPGADNPEAFWQMLHDGIDGISEVPVTRWEATQFYAKEQATPGKMNTRWGGFLQNIEQFDPTFFSISPREAMYMDPQQRLLLEVAWEAFEHAGLVPEKLTGSRTGVFVGISSVDNYALHYTARNYHQAYTGTGNAHSIAANRLSYTFDLRGPSMAIDTACSSSLVAVHQACLSLRNGECDLALAGGVNVILMPELAITFSQARTMSSDGRCKTFDESADGYVRSEGCGLVLLKPLEAAERDGDPILAIVRGSAVNQDGRSNGLTAPNGPSQEEVIRSALQHAGVSPNEISYVETHGSATPLGDPIEVESLKAVFMQDRRQDQLCLLGAVKTNIGHLEAAAGIAGLIKTILCLQKGVIVPNLHFKTLNPHISFAGTTLEIPTKPRQWPGQPDAQRFAGVSAFGFGGTNAHVIIEGAPQEANRRDSALRLSEPPVHLLTLSGRTAQALSVLAQRYQDFLVAHSTDRREALSLRDICFTANTGRTHFAHRLAVSASNTEQLREHLAAFVAGQPGEEIQVGHIEAGQRQIAFLFPGQGCQYVNMARQLYETQPTFRAALDECDRLLRPLLPQDRSEEQDQCCSLCASRHRFARSLLSVLYPVAGEPSPLNETAYTQPALFALEYALAQMWLSWGIKPEVVMGHSLGEYVAACIAGLFSLEDGLKLIAARGRLMQSLPEHGTMATIFAEPEHIQPFLEPYKQYVAIAALNGPQHTVISGREELVHLIVQRLETEMVAKGILPAESVILTISQASHCPLVDPMLDAFEQVAREVTFLPLRIPLVCNLTGQLLGVGETLDAGYWRRHTREPVQFVTGIQRLSSYGCEIFLELGPTPILSKMGKRCLPVGRGSAQDTTNGAVGTVPCACPMATVSTQVTWLSSLDQNQDDWYVLMRSIASLYTKGCNLNWSGLDCDSQDHRRDSSCLRQLPTYPFEREYCWFKGEERNQGDRGTVNTVQLKTTEEGESRRDRDKPCPKVLDGEGLGQGQALSLRDSGTTSLIDFGLIFFSSNASAPTSSTGGKYHLIIESAKYADQHGFSSVWIPERHFTKEGWLYPNPAILLTALAGETSHIHLRAGSVVVPLHHPLRIAEDWAMVDNLSGGRVGVSFASGWHPNDFSLAPDHYADRHEVMYRNIEIVRKLWRGETVPFKGGDGKLVELQTYPSPMQHDIPIWLTAAGNPQTFANAGKLGANLLTHLYNQSIDELAEKIRIYRDARAENGHDPVTGKVSVMLHTYVGADMDTVRAQVQGPFSHYLRSASYLIDAIAYSRGQQVDLSRLSEQELQDYLGFVTDRLISQQRVLFGTPETCASLVTQLQIVGVDEIACQIDFGVESDLVLRSLPYLNKLRGIVGTGLAPLTPTNSMGNESRREGSCAPPSRRSENAMGHDAEARHDDGGVARWRNARPLPTSPQNEINQWLFQRNVLHALGNAGEEARLMILTTYVQEQIADILQVPVQRLDTEQPLTTLGFDSLMTIELKNRLDLDLRIRVPILSLLQEASITHFVKHILTLEGPWVGDRSVATGGQGQAAPTVSVSQCVDDGQAQDSVPTASSRPLRAFAPSPTPIVPTYLPLSHNQKALWFLYGLAPESTAYNVLYSARIQQRLDIPALQRTLQVLADRYPVLTSTYTLQNGEPVQQIQKNQTIPLEEIDAASASLDDLKQLLLRESNWPIDLTKGPILRLQLYRLADNHRGKPDGYVLGFIIHHIAADFRALEILVDELYLLYEREKTGMAVSSSIPQRQGQQPDFQNADYVRWQQSMLQSQEGEQHWQYWQNELAGDIPVLNLPTDRPRPPVQTYKGASHSFSFSPDLTKRLRAVAHAEKVTLFTLMLTAYQVLLHRYTQQDDILVGMPALGRTRSEWERVIGYLANPVIVRARFAHSPTFKDLLQQTKQGVLAALEHQDFPFPLLIERLQLHRDPSYSPLCQTLFIWDRPYTRRGEDLGQGLVGKGTETVGTRTGAVGTGPAQGTIPTAPALSLEPFVYGQQGAPFDLSLTVFEMEDRLSADFRYNVDLFDASTLARMAEHFLTLLDGITNNWEQCGWGQALTLQELPLLSESERNTILLEWNATKTGGTVGVGTGTHPLTPTSSLGKEQVHVRRGLAPPLRSVPSNGFPIRKQRGGARRSARWRGARLLPTVRPGRRFYAFVGVNGTHPVSTPKALLQDSRDLCVHQLFELQVEQTPDAIAIVFDDVACGFTPHLSYHELNAQANHLAHRLLGEGVGPERLVGIYMERSLEMLVSILAIFKAGEAYLPLDPSYPEQRLLSLLQESQIHIILTQPSLRVHLHQASLTVLVVESLRQASVPDNREALPTRNHADNLAYVIYTSGSTGLPKGAMVTQRGMVNHLFAKIETLQLMPTERIAQTAPACFDISVWQFLAALLVGGQVSIVPDEIAHDPELLFSRVSEQGITVLELIPSLLQAGLDNLIEKGANGSAALNLHRMLVTGEVCPTRLVDLWEQCYPQIPLVNAYGPTECSDDVTHAVLTPTTDIDRSLPDSYDSRVCPNASIGRPIANTQIYILDQQMQPLPIGVPGEIYVGGIGVGRGYLYDPVRTALAFVPNPFVGTVPRARPIPPIETGQAQGTVPTGERLYRTGDRGRYRTDGAIEYLGRIDQQIKLRGYRIELGEIEAALRTYAGVQEAVVVLREEDKARKYLVAYVVPTTVGVEQAQGTALQEHLCERLPNYMVPANVVFLESLPLTPNGKVDRKALEQGIWSAQGTGQGQALSAPTALGSHESTFVAPREPVEHILTTIWQQVLRVRTQVGIHDNFFILGGDSILSLQIIARARQAGLELTPKQLFQHQTIAQLAKVVVPKASPPVPTAPYPQEEVIGPVPLTPIQHWFFEQNLPQPQHFNQFVVLQVPTMGTGLAPVYVPTAPVCWHFQHTLDAWLVQHDVLRLRYECTETGWQQRLVSSAEAGTVPFEYIDLTQIGASEQASLVEQIANHVQASLDLKHGPLLRAVLFILGNGQPARLLIVIHHLAVDGISWRVLLEELQMTMQAARPVQTQDTGLTLQREEPTSGAVGAIPCGRPQAPPARTASFQSWTQYLQKTIGAVGTRRDSGLSLSACACPMATSALDNDRAYWLKAAQVPTMPLPVELVGSGSAQGTTIGAVGTRRDSGLSLSACACPMTTAPDHRLHDCSTQRCNTEAWAHGVSIVLTVEETRLLLHEALRPYRSHVQELLLVALLQTLACWMGTQQIRLDLEGHGREELLGETLDVSRTVGWFTSLYPVLFTLPQDAEQEVSDRHKTHSLQSRWIKTIKEQLRSVPHKGITYGILRYLHEDHETREKLASASPSQVSFNYLGQFDIGSAGTSPIGANLGVDLDGEGHHKGADEAVGTGLCACPSSTRRPLDTSQAMSAYRGGDDGLVPSPDRDQPYPPLRSPSLQPPDLRLQSSGFSSGPENPRSHLLDVSAKVVGGQLHLQWTYSEQLHQRTTIEALAQEFLQALRELLAHCLEPGVGGLTPSDFPLVRLDYATLDRLEAVCSQRSGASSIGTNLGVGLDGEGYHKGADEAVGTGPCACPSSTRRPLDTPQAMSAYRSGDDGLVPSPDSGQPYPPLRSPFPHRTLKDAPIGASPVPTAPIHDPTSPNGIEDIYPLTPLQQGLLFHTLSAPQSGVYVEQMSCTLRGEVWTVGAGLAPTSTAPLIARAWQEVTNHHAILRTAFMWQEVSEPVQVVYRHVTLPLGILDWRSRSPRQQQADLEAFLQVDRAQGFDVEQAPLMRLTLIRLSETRTQMIWTHHQLLLDGWSLFMVLQEVFACYEAEMQGQRLVYEERRPYRDYISWLAEQKSEEAEAYWRQALAGLVAPTPLGVGRNTSERTLQAPQFHAEEALLVEAVTAERWQEYARQQHVTLNTLVQAAWALVLSRYSGQEDVVFGTVVAGRPPELAGVERTIGLFINTVPVRVQVRDEDEVGVWLTRLQEQQIGQCSYEYSSLVQVQGWYSQGSGTNPNGMSHERLFESLLVFQNYPVPAELAERNAHIVKAGSVPVLEVEATQMVGQTNYPLTILVEPGMGRDRSGEVGETNPLQSSQPYRQSPQPLLLRVKYDRQSLEPATIQRLLLHIQNCLQQFVADPQQKLAAVSLLTKDERELIPLQGSCSPLRDVCIHHLFEHQVKQTPERVAMVWGEEHLTYDYLNHKANQLANYLHRRDSALRLSGACPIGPEVHVGLFLEKGPIALVALLAVLKAGGVSVFLDPALPEVRLAAMVQDAHLQLVLTQESLLKESLLEEGDRRGDPLWSPVWPNHDRISPHGRPQGIAPTRIPILCYEQLWETLQTESEINPAVQLEATNLAYIVYTSGSTGRPKGVLSTHAGVVNYLRFLVQTYELQTEMIVLQIPPLAFDASVRDIFGTLVSGGRLVLTRSHETRDLGRVLALLQEHQVTHLLSIVPSFLSILLDTAQTLAQTCPSVRLVLVSGENLPLAQVARTRQVLAEHVEVVNQYGPTETTMTATYYQVRDHVDAGLALGTAPTAIVEGAAHVGRPIPNMQVYLLDRRFHPVPLGVVGEVYLGGPGLARGYLEQPDATAEKFVPHPFVEIGQEQQTGERLYRTGDLARYQPDGSIEYLGRRDQQVKIRGNRVELGEIERLLVQYPGVKQCIAMVREDHLGEPPMGQAHKLVTYLVAEPECEVPPTEELRDFLHAQLPDYMLPDYFVPLEALPLTPNGKVDRQALLATAITELTKSNTFGVFVKAQTRLQERLAEIWAELLHLSQIGIHDNFFRLGGHSLLATLLMMRIRSTFEVAIPLRSLFEAPTIAEMTKIIEQAQIENMQAKFAEQEEEAEQILAALEAMPNDTNLRSEG